MRRVVSAILSPVKEGPYRAEVEREADAFAAALLMPSYLLNQLVNKEPLSKRRLEFIAREFQTSLVSTAIRCVLHSHFPCCLVGIRNGAVAYSFASLALIGSGIYPPKRGSRLPSSGHTAWQQFVEGSLQPCSNEVLGSAWLQIFREKFRGVWARQEFIPARTLETLLVLVTIAEDDLIEEEPDEYDDDED